MNRPTASPQRKACEKPQPDTQCRRTRHIPKASAHRRRCCTGTPGQEATRTPAPAEPGSGGAVPSPSHKRERDFYPRPALQAAFALPALHTLRHPPRRPELRFFAVTAARGIREARALGLPPPPHTALASPPPAGGARGRGKARPERNASRPCPPKGQGPKQFRCSQLIPSPARGRGWPERAGRGKWHNAAALSPAPLPPAGEGQPHPAKRYLHYRFQGYPPSGQPQATTK
jgi:hypothetical protein